MYRKHFYKHCKYSGTRGWLWGMELIQTTTREINSRRRRWDWCLCISWTLVIILFSSKLCVLIGRVPDQGGGDDHSRLEDDGSLTICRLVPSVFSLMINRDILENLVIRNPSCIWTLLMLRNRIQATISFVKKLLSSKVQDISGFKWFWAQMFSMYSF